MLLFEVIGVVRLMFWCRLPEIGVLLLEVIGVLRLMSLCVFARNMCVVV